MWITKKSRKRIWKKPAEAGFTLVELLVITAILGMIAMAVVSGFASGLRVYQRVQGYEGFQNDVLLALEKMERDIRNTMDFNEIKFIGDRKSVSFAGLVASTDRKGKQAMKPGRILYYLAGVKDMLFREEQHYPRAISDEIRKGKGARKALVQLKSARFSYYYFDSDEKEYKWKDSWKPDDEEGDEEEESEKDKGIPLGVKIVLEFTDGANDVEFGRTVFIPVASNPALELDSNAGLEEVSLHE